MANLRNHHLGCIFQTYNLLAVYTVYENVELPLLLLKMPAIERKQTVLQSLEWVGLTDKMKSRPAQLSGGECQRVAVVRSLINRPKLILADEPTGALDRASAENLGRLLVELNEEEKVTLIAVTHSLELAGQLGRTLELKDGQLV